MIWIWYIRALAILVCVLAAGPANATYSSEVSLVASGSGLFDPLSAGGSDVGSAYVSDAGAQTGDEYWRGLYGEAFAGVDSGELSTGLFGTAWTEDFITINGGGIASSQTFDTFAIETGSSGLDDGTPVQVLVQVRLDGEVRLSGRSSESDVRFSVGTATDGLLNYWTGPLIPPVVLDVQETWEFLVDTSIGATVTLASRLSTVLDGSVFGPFESGRNYLDFDAIVRVTNAPGFETIGIDPESGAPTTPIPTAEDFDGDGIDDAFDNCLGIYNPPQLDTNGDNLGNACDPDVALPDDCFVNFLDLATMRDPFFSNPGSPSWNPDADFNGDNRINFLDLAVMRQFFFNAPGPSLLVNVCSPTVLISGTVTLHPGMAIDLDAGVETTTDDPDADVAWSVVAAPHHVFFEPRHGAHLDDYGLAEPDWAYCILSSPVEEPVPFAVVGVGTYLCVLTSGQRIARFEVSSSDADVLQEATELGISYTTWQ